MRAAHVAEMAALLDRPEHHAQFVAYAEDGQALGLAETERVVFFRRLLRHEP